MPRRLALVAAALLGLVAVVAPAGVARADAGPGPGWQRQMLVEVNALRSAAGAPPVRLCAALGRAAGTHARDLAHGAPFGHVGADGRTPGDRVREQGYIWRAVGENVAAGQWSVREVMESWVTSPGHLANLLNPGYRHMGVAVVVDSRSDYGIYWVQDFGTGGPCRARTG